jgi:hypothetical protein
MNFRWSYSCLLAALLLCLGSVHARGPGGGSGNKSLGPQGGTTVVGTRTVNGANASSTVSVSGPQGNGITGTASSIVVAGKGSGQASLQTTGGKSVTMKGKGQVTSNSVSGSGSATTGSGKTVTASGTVTKTDTGVAASGSATTGGGKTVSAEVNGSKEGGTATVTNGKGSSKTTNYGDQRP